MSADNNINELLTDVLVLTKEFLRPYKMEKQKRILTRLAKRATVYLRNNEQIISNYNFGKEETKKKIAMDISNLFLKFAEHVPDKNNPLRKKYSCESWAVKDEQNNTIGQTHLSFALNEDGTKVEDTPVCISYDSSNIRFPDFNRLQLNENVIDDMELDKGKTSLLFEDDSRCKSAKTCPLYAITRENIMRQLPEGYFIVGINGKVFTLVTVKNIPAAMKKILLEQQSLYDNEEKLLYDDEQSMLLKQQDIEKTFETSVTKEIKEISSSSSSFSEELEEEMVEKEMVEEPVYEGTKVWIGPMMNRETGNVDKDDPLNVFLENKRNIYMKFYEAQNNHLLQQLGVFDSRTTNSAVDKMMKTLKNKDQKIIDEFNLGRNMNSDNFFSNLLNRFPPSFFEYWAYIKPGLDILKENYDKMYNDLHVFLNYLKITDLSDNDKALQCLIKRISWPFKIDPFEEENRGKTQDYLEIEKQNIARLANKRSFIEELEYVTKGIAKGPIYNDLENKTLTYFLQAEDQSDKQPEEANENYNYKITDKVLKITQSEIDSQVTNLIPIGNKSVTYEKKFETDPINQQYVVEIDDELYQKLTMKERKALFDKIRYQHFQGLTYDEKKILGFIKENNASDHLYKIVSKDKSGTKKKNKYAIDFYQELYIAKDNNVTYSILKTMKNYDSSKKDTHIFTVDVNNAEVMNYMKEVIMYTSDDTVYVYDPFLAVLRHRSVIDLIEMLYDVFEKDKTNRYEELSAEWMKDYSERLDVPNLEEIKKFHKTHLASESIFEFKDENTPQKMLKDKFFKKQSISKLTPIVYHIINGFILPTNIEKLKDDIVDDEVAKKIADFQKNKLLYNGLLTPVFFFLLPFEYKDYQNKIKKQKTNFYFPCIVPCDLDVTLPFILKYTQRRLENTRIKGGEKLNVIAEDFKTQLDDIYVHLPESDFSNNISYKKAMEFTEQQYRNAIIMKNHMKTCTRLAPLVADYEAKNLRDMDPLKVLMDAINDIKKKLNAERQILKEDEGVNQLLIDKARDKLREKRKKIKEEQLSSYIEEEEEQSMRKEQQQQTSPFENSHPQSNIPSEINSPQSNIPFERAVIEREEAYLLSLAGP